MCLSSASLRLQSLRHLGHGCNSLSSSRICVFLCRRTSLLRLNERWHSSHEPLSSFFLGFFSARCDPEPPPLDDAVLKLCTSNGLVAKSKSMAVSSATQFA